MVEVGGRPIRALKAGEGDGTPIVFVHGFGGDLNSWMFNQPALAEGRATWAVDLPGHGGSTKEVGEGTIAAMAATVGAFMDASDIPRAHLVGHSMGGAIILALALATPARAASLTLVAPAGLGREVDIGYIEGFIAADKRRDIKPHLEKLFGDPALVTRDLIEDVLKLKRVDGVVPALKTVAAAAFPGGAQARVFRDDLGRIEVPIQVVWGRADRILPAAHAEGLPLGIAVHLLDGKGHMVHMEAAGEVNRLIAEIAAG
jgi:pyruvate dehydrogenase E2 component (dihydrolipoamide acetyltransferase)